jgi:7-cyano-7-deazaguanine synthase
MGRHVMRALLLSGGLDSTAIAFHERPDVCITLDYGQRPAKGEIAAASSICLQLGLRHEILRVDLSALGVGSLSGKRPSGLGSAPEWWPFRNQMLITLAAMRLVPEGLKEIMIGAVATDVHADGKAPFLRQLDRLMRGQEGKVRVSAPALRKSPFKLIQDAGIPKSILGATFSCHLMEYACGQCRGCEKHRDTLALLDRTKKAAARSGARAARRRK